MSDLRLQKTVGMAELIDVEVPDRYLTVPPSIRQGPPLNVGSAYLQLANAIKGGRAASPDFGAAVMRHKTLDRVEEAARRSEEHTSELQSLMRISYAVFCLKKKNQHDQRTRTHQHARTIDDTPTREHEHDRTRDTRRT